MVDGVLLLDKPLGVTSNAALQVARRLLAARKAGHTGTLDPLASGLLPLACGEAAKFSVGLLEADKTYLATLHLGIATTTGDVEGDVTERRPVAVAAADLEPVLAAFVGPIEQVPPMHSALKRDGRPLYDYARAGIELARAPRTVTIHRLVAGRFDGERLEFEVTCSKGTYVRVLAQDIGSRLGCGAHLSALRRTRVGSLALDGAVTLDALERMTLAERREQLLPPETLLAALPRLDLDAGHSRRLRCGQRLALGLAPSSGMQVYDDQGQLIGIAAVDSDGVLAPRRLITESNLESEFST
jgi:tRNA pseudouridine55 synthase